MKTRTITDSVPFGAHPRDVYNLLMDSEQHGAFTGEEATIGQKPGEPFSAYSGNLHGNIVELVPGERIVLSWRGEHEHWPKDHFSQVIMQFVNVDGHTQLELEQTGVPEACYEDFARGWWDYYWHPMQALFGK